jgi:hypothetical protein
MPGIQEMPCTTADAPHQAESARGFSPTSPDASQAFEHIKQVAASLKPDDVAAVIANPFSERSREILSPFPDITTQVEDRSILHHLHSQLGLAHQAINHTPTLHAQWVAFTENLTNGSINPLILSPKEYFDTLRSLVGVKVDDTTSLGHPFDITIVKLLETQTLMRELVYSLDQEPPATGKTPIYSYHHALQEKLGASFTLQTVGTVEFTPLGIVLHVSPKNLAENGSEHAAGLNIRGLDDPRWNGMISIVATEAYLDPRSSTKEDLNTREHELRHALQHLVRPSAGVTLAALSSELSAILSDREAGAITSADGKVSSLINAFAGQVKSYASEEMASYLSEGDAHTPLKNSQLGTQRLTTALGLVERTLWEARIPEEEKQRLYRICSNTCLDASRAIHSGQAGIELATQRRTWSGYLRSAIELGGLSDLPQALVVYGVGQTPSEVENSMNSYLQQRIIGATHLQPTFFESLRDVRLYHALLGTPECPPWSDVHEALLRNQNEKPHFSALIAHAASQGSELAKHLQLGTPPQMVSASPEHIAVLYNHLAPPVVNAMTWLSAASPVAALRSLLPNLAECAVTDPTIVYSLISDATEHLRLIPPGSIPQKELNAFELDALKARTALAIANDSWAPLDTPKGEQYLTLRVALERLAHQLHIQAGLDGGFHLYGGDAHLKTLIGPPSESPTLDHLRAIALHAPEWSKYWKCVTRDLVAQLNTVEDLPYLLMIAQNTENLSLAGAAASNAASLIFHLPPEELPYARQLLGHRFELTRIAWQRDDAWRERQQQNSH